MCPPIEQDDHFPADFRLLCPHFGQAQILFTRQSSLLSFFSETSDSWIWSTLARPIAGARPQQSFHRKHSTQKLARLEQLPNEILDEILDLVFDDNESTLAFGLSSPIFWPVLLHRIHHEYAKFAASWEGTKIAFQGKHTPFTSMQSQEYGLDETEYRKGASPVFEQITPLERQWRETTQSVRHWTGFATEDWVSIEADLSLSYMWPQDRIWVLRNLTTSEFVRSDKLYPSKDSIPAQEEPGFFQKMFKQYRRKDDAPRISHDTSPVTLGQVLLVMTCFSSCVPWSEYPFLFQTGKWHDCAFDLVPLDTHLTETNPTEWADVSELAVDDIGNLRWWVRKSGGEFSRKNHSKHWERIVDDRDLFHRWEGEESANRPAKDEPYRFFRKRAQTGILISLNRSS